MVSLKHRIEKKIRSVTVDVTGSRGEGVRLDITCSAGLWDGIGMKQQPLERHPFTDVYRPVHLQAPSKALESAK